MAWGRVLNSYPTVPGSPPPDINPRTGRGVQRTAPEQYAIAAPAPKATLSPPFVPALPFNYPAVPRARLGPVPKLAPGRQGSGLGAGYSVGMQTNWTEGHKAGISWTPLEPSYALNPNYRKISIPRSNGAAGQHVDGSALQPTYKADNFRPAQHFFNQARSVPPWAQASFTPQQRVLIPSQQPTLLSRKPVGLAVPSAQQNSGLYAFGYPTRRSVAARIGGGTPSTLGAGNLA